MQRLFAIVGLTWKAAFRFRLFWVLAILLLGSVVALPLLLKDDGTARGFTQILLTYNLSVITVLLGFCTLWLACGTLARDVEECQMQMVAVKPIARWEIWLGKWIGIVLLNAALLALSGGSVYALLQWRAQRLPADQLRVLQNEVFVARASLKAPSPDIEADVIFHQQRQKFNVPPNEQAALREQLRERIKAYYQAVEPGFYRDWVIDLGFRKAFLRDRPLYVRTKFFSAQTNALATYVGTWMFGAPGTDKFYARDTSMAAETFHEMEIPPNLFADDGKLTIRFMNHDSVTLLFTLEEGLEVLYREGGFGLNFARGLGIILCWLSLLAALGLTSASLLSFPVAAFFSLSVLVVALSSGTLSNVVSEGTVLGLNHETGASSSSWADATLVRLFSGILWIVNLAQDFSPVDSLSTGRSITWGQLGLACVKIVLLLGGLISAIGIFIFTRRELATAQGTN